MGIFKTNKFLVKFYFNKLEITNLINNETISKKAPIPFSNSRLIISDFVVLEELLKAMISELIHEKSFLGIFSKRCIVAQIIEELDTDIFQSEKISISNSLQHAGAREVYFSEKTTPISNKEALETTKDKSKLIL